MSVKQAELCRAWGLSRGRVSQMVKAGLPLGSLEEAEAWRVAHYGGRAVKSQQGGGDKSQSVGTGGADLPPQPPVPNLNDIDRMDLAGVAARLQRAEYEAWQKWNNAFIAGRDNEALIAARHYEAMVKPLISTSEKLASIRLQEGVTVLMSEAKELYGRFLYAVRMTLKNMPSRLAARCNPSDPALAKQTLNEAVERIFKTLNNQEM